MASGKFEFKHPDDALRALAQKLTTVAITHGTRIDDCVGRVLASGVIADRDSPAADVSAMDGYAVRLADLKPESTVPIADESAPGSPPPAMPDGAVVRIFTGAIVPFGADAVVKREDTDELDQSIRFRTSALTAQPGENIRRAGENAAAGSIVLDAGRLIDAAALATMANFGCATADLHAVLRVSIITTGDEVRSVADDQPQAWQLRNSNRSSLAGMLKMKPWIDIRRIEHARDDRQSLTDLISQCLDQSDAIVLTGGVSMGNYDYVPDVVSDLGGEVVFHGLPIRPGKPILGAATGNGKLIVGLPGNPVSATIGCRRMALPLLASLSGQTNWLLPCSVVTIADADDHAIPLHWMRLVKQVDHGVVEMLVSQGSGDLVSLGRATGFVELPPGQSGAGPWPYYGWT